MKRLRLETWCGLALAVTIGYAAVLGATTDFTRRALPDDLRSPMLALNLARDEAAVALVLGPVGSPQDARPLVRRQVALDWAFIVLYAGTLMLLAAVQWRSGSGAGRHLRRALVIAAGITVLGAAGCDIVENRRLLALIDGGAFAEHATRPWSLAKWGLVFAAIGALAPALIDGSLPGLRRWLGYVAAALAVRTAVVGLTGVAGGADLWVESGVRALSASLVAALVFFATHRLLKDGLLERLDWLAIRRPFRWLTNWPSDETDTTP